MPPLTLSPVFSHDCASLDQGGLASRTPNRTQRYVFGLLSRSDQENPFQDDHSDQPMQPTSHAPRCNC
jgi:hypothetical protein